MFYCFLFVNTNMNTFLGTFLEKKNKPHQTYYWRDVSCRKPQLDAKLKKKKKLCMYLKRRVVLDMKKCNDGE